MLIRAFKEWKRIDYQIVLEGLKKYSATLDKNITRTFHTKKSFFRWGKLCVYISNYYMIINNSI